MIAIIGFFTLTLFSLTSASGCPKYLTNYRYCNCQSTWIWSEERRLDVKCSQLTQTDLEKVVQSLQGYDVQKLSIERSNIQLLHKDLFRNITIRELDLKASNIDDIEDGVFGAIRNLENLLLCKLTIDDIPDLTNTSSLKSLEILHHKIETLRDGDFEDLGSLRTLKINIGALAKIEDGALVPLVNLTMLDLSDNHLTELPESFLSKESKLKILILKENLLDALPESSSDLKYLKKLDLTSNVFRTIPKIPFEKILKQETEVNLTEDRIICDKNLCWLAKLDEDYYISISIRGYCTFNASYSDHYLDDLFQKTLNCS